MPARVPGVVNVPAHQWAAFETAPVSAGFKSKDGLAWLNVPDAAVIFDADGYYVFVQEAPGRFHKRKVERVNAANGQTSLSAGLRAGEQIVTRGALTLNWMEQGH